MQVKAIDRLSVVSRSRGRGRASGGGAAFEIENGARPSKATGTTRPAAAGGLDMLLSLQGVEPFADQRRRALDDSHRLLDLLDDLKIGFLSGDVSAERLARLESALIRYQLPTADPELAEILKAIDLRARVELAKLRRMAG